MSVRGTIRVSAHVNDTATEKEDENKQTLLWSNLKHCTALKGGRALHGALGRTRWVRAARWVDVAWGFEAHQRGRVHYQSAPLRAPIVLLVV